MPRFLVVGVLLLSICSRASAQKVGDTQEEICAALGQPEWSGGSQREGLIWKFKGGVRVIFRNRVVVAIEGLKTSEPAAPEVSVSESAKVVPGPKQTPPHVEEREAPADERASAPKPTVVPWKPERMFIAFIGVALVSIVCQVLILIQAFKTDIWWGLGSLFVPFVVLIFIARNWSDVRKPFLVNLAAAGALPVIVFMM